MKTERDKTDECKEFEYFFHPWDAVIISRLVQKKFEKSNQIAIRYSAKLNEAKYLNAVLADRLRSVTSQCKISPETECRQTIIPACYDRNGG